MTEETQEVKIKHKRSPRWKYPEKLNEEEIEIVLDDTLNAVPMRVTAKTLGFPTKQHLHRFYIRNPELNEQVKVMRVEACEAIEDSLLDLPNEFKGDAKMAKVMLDMRCKVLAYRNPAKYSQRIDMNVNQTISITSNLNAANDRIQQIMRAVEPIAIQGAVSNP